MKLERARQDKDKGKVYLYGKHALREALLGRPEAVQKVFMDANAMQDTELVALAQKHGLAINAMKGDDSKKAVGEDAVHQGVIAVIAPGSLQISLEKMLDILAAKEKVTGHKNPCIVLLDELQDPHNVGAIIRSAAAFGASAVLIPEHNQAPITGTVIKTSAGMVFRVPIVSVGNVNQTLRTLKDKGFWVYGLVMEGASSLPKTAFDTPTVFVIGNESAGIRQKTLELCDVTLSVPMDPQCESLNASVAASVVLYEWFRAR